LNKTAGLTMRSVDVKSISWWKIFADRFKHFTFEEFTWL